MKIPRLQMNAEIDTTNLPASYKNELLISKQKNEIMELKFENQKLQTEKVSRLEDSLFSPTLYAHYNKIAEMLSGSDIIPKSYKGKPADIFVAMAMGYQLGFPVEQSLQDIAVIQGRPCLWGDGLLSLCLNHPECRGIKEDPIYKGENVFGYRCTVMRKGHDAHTQEFTLDDAKQAGLIGRNVWAAYPSRMLQMRARSLALRDKFADALRGLRVGEIEKEDGEIIEGELANDATELTTQTQKLKKLLSKKSDIKEEEVSETPSDPNQKITKGRLEEIKKLLDEKKVTKDRQEKALQYFKIEKLEDLTNDQTRILLMQIGR